MTKRYKERRVMVLQHSVLRLYNPRLLMRPSHPSGVPSFRETRFSSRRLFISLCRHLFGPHDLAWLQYSFMTDKSFPPGFIGISLKSLIFIGFLILAELHFPWQAICRPFIANALLTNLKFMIYENHRHRSTSNTANDIVKPVFATNINGAG
jgi:hypothetical protein